MRSGPVIVQQGGRFTLIQLQAPVSFSSDAAALAGLVDGSFTAGIFVKGRQYLSYSFADTPPFVYICLIGAVLRIRFKLLGTAFLMELSLEPSMSQLSMTSQTAIWLRSRKFLFSFVDAGSGSFRSAARTGQKRFLGWP